MIRPGFLSSAFRVAWPWIGGIACLAVSVWMVYAAGRPKDTLQFVADRFRHDFGDIRQAEVVKTEFVLTNRDREPIELVTVQSSCGCTAALPSDKVLQPGHSTRLTVQMSTGTARGEQLSTVQIVYRGVKSGRQEYLPLQVSAHVKPEFHYAPSAIVLPVGRPNRFVVNFWPGEQPDFQITGARTTTPELFVTWAPPLSGGTVWALQVQYQPEASTAAKDRAEVIVTTNSKRRPQCSIPVTFVGSESPGQ
ncbi:MAG: hypothetical protein KatS3mg110_4500 [Pirellulaceae bacterium]|nr:MAG: hypothetical protein KatS3mg110_4500 [Pirellulaceae bacterium]